MISAHDPGFRGWTRILEEWFEDRETRIKLLLTYTRDGHIIACNEARAILAVRDWKAKKAKR